MSPTATIAHDMNAENIIRRMGRDSYQKYHNNVAEARKRAEKYRYQRKCTR